MTLLKLVIESKSVTIGDLKSLAGRLELFMGPSGKFERGFIIAASNTSEVKTDQGRCTASLISQCQWWARAITVALTHSPIPDPYVWEPMVTVGVFPDAAREHESWTGSRSCHGGPGRLLLVILGSF